MRWRPVLAVSLVANLLFAAGWWMTDRYFNTKVAELRAGTEAGTNTITKTAVVVRRQYFSWQQVESADYPTYVANLREIGCPEQTIRDIIVADVNSLYARRRATEILTAQQQWWRADADAGVQQLADAKTRELDQERRDLLTHLLGTSWEAGDLISLPRPTRQGVPLDGPVLGILPADVKQAVEAIVIRSQERIQAYTEAQRAAGQPVDPAELVRQQQQLRNELAGVLSPAQLEEYVLRYSPGAGALRTELGQLKFFTTSPDEFRTLFHATDEIDQQLQALAGATDPASALRRRILESQRDTALKTALGDERYQQFQLMHDPAYRDAYTVAQTSGAAESVGTVYEINQAATQELASIRANTNLSSEQLAIEMKKAELEQLKATAAALGQEVPTDPPPAPKPEPQKTHVLAPGENLDFLARLYGVNPDALQAANPNLDLKHLKPGQSVSVPIRLMPPLPVPQ